MFKRFYKRNKSKNKTENKCNTCKYREKGVLAFCKITGLPLSKHKFCEFYAKEENEGNRKWMR